MNAPVQQPPQIVVNIKMTPPGVELVIGALRKLPHEQVDGLVQEIWGQYQQEIQRLQAEAAAAEEAAKAEAAAAEKAAKKAAKAAPAPKKTEVAKAVDEAVEDPLA